MKKQYNKPQLRYEDFRLMDAIAANCAIAAHHDNKNTCSYFDDQFELSIFVVGVVADCVIDEIGEVGSDILFPS